MSIEPSGRDVVVSNLESSVIEFFAAYGVACSKTASAESIPGPEMGSIVGFRGPGVRGGLAFVAPAELIARMLPIPKKPAGAELQLRDWSAEIANQLVGRLKNKLSQHDIDFAVGTPVCFRGSSIRLSFLPEADGITLDFATGADGVRVYLDCALEEESVGEASSPPVRIIPEGEVLLF